MKPNLNVSSVPSPCVNICVMQTADEARLMSPDAQALCKGCARTINEIAAWGQMNDEEKRDVWTAIEQRRPQLRP